ncbi:MAG TPA: hypothetical protein VLK84_10320 [Longimicrobium sp.]|nr:hypothetical protein [Longimicrobium sp.]
MEPLSVPFSITTNTKALDGVIIMRGVLATQADGLVLEYTAAENYYGIKPTVETGIRTLTIPWTEIQSLQYRRLYWGLGPGALVLQTRSLRALEGVSAAQGNELTLQVRRVDHLAARELASSVELALAEHRLLAFEARDEPRSLDPGEPPRTLPSA